MITIEGECAVLEERECTSAEVLQRRLNDRKLADDARYQAQWNAIKFGIGHAQRMSRERFQWTQQQDPNDWHSQHTIRTNFSSTIGGLGGSVNSIFNIWNS